MAEVTVTIDGKDHKVDESAIKLPQGHAIYSKEALKQTHVERSELNASYVHSDEVKSRVDTEVSRRFADFVKRDEAAKDPTVISTVLKNNGADQADQIDLEAEKKKWKDEELQPKLDELSSLKGVALGSSINQAAVAARFDPKFATRPDPRTPSYLESVLSSKFEWDGKIGQFVAVENGNKVTSVEPKEGNPWQGPEEYISRLAKQDGWKPYLAPEPKNDRGPGYGKGAPGSTGGEGDKSKSPREMSDSERARYYVDKYGDESEAA